MDWDTPPVLLRRKAGTPRRTRQNQKEFSETLILHPISFPLIRLLVFNSIYSFLYPNGVQWPSLALEAAVPTTAWCPGHLLTENTICRISWDWTPESLLGCSEKPVSHPWMRKGEAVLTFFETSENDNSIAFSYYKRRNQKTSYLYSLKEEIRRHHIRISPFKIKETQRSKPFRHRPLVWVDSQSCHQRFPSNVLNLNS